MANAVIYTGDVCRGHTYGRQVHMAVPTEHVAWSSTGVCNITANEQGLEAQTEDKEKIVQSKRRQYSRFHIHDFVGLFVWCVLFRQRPWAWAWVWKYPLEHSGLVHNTQLKRMTAPPPQVSVANRSSGRDRATWVVITDCRQGQSCAGLLQVTVARRSWLHRLCHGQRTAIHPVL